MAHFNFVIPSRREELLTDNGEYYVKDVRVPKEMLNQLKVSKVLFREKGVEFILESFQVFYSVLHQEANLPLDLIFKSYEDLHLATTDLHKAISLLLEDKTSLNKNVELKQKYQNILKMLIYVYIETVLLIENKNVTTARNESLMKGKKKAKVDIQFNLNKKGIILNLLHVLENDIGIFWDPPVVEEKFTNMIAEVCYRFLQNPDIRREKEEKEEIFNLLGTLIKMYNHSTTFAIRIVQLIKDKSQEHLVQCIAEDIKQLVENFNCKGLVHVLVTELTEWQTDERFQDSQGSRLCAQFLSAMGIAMPQLMLPEIMYLDQYLCHESPNLRIAVLSVLAELVLFVSSKENLSKEEEEYKEGIYVILVDHMRDISPFVRSKVFQSWSKLYKEGVLPNDLVLDILQNIVDTYLFDKATLVRKAAANCLSVLLTHNKFGSELSLANMRKELKTKQAMFETILPEIEKAKALRQEKWEGEWEKMVPRLKKVFYEEIQKQDSEDELAPQMDKQQAADIIRIYMSEQKFAEAFRLFKNVFVDECDDIDENEDKEKIVDEFFVNHFKEICMGMHFMDLLKEGYSHGSFCMTADDVNKFVALKDQVEYYTEVVKFLEQMEKAVIEMVELLDTTSMSDMHEAVEFFISAYRFKIDNAEDGIMAMLQIMRRNEQERKDVIIEAFKTIYLKTDSPSGLSEHCETVVKRLIGLLKSVNDASMDCLEAIIAEWAAKGFLDNNIINMLWNYFTRRTAVSDEEWHASLELLRMTALSRKTIVTRNITLVTTMAFGENSNHNLAFIGTACQFLAVAGRDRVDIASADPPFKIAPDDPIFQKIFQLLFKNFFEPVPFYYKALSGAIEFVYKVSGKPEHNVEPFVKEIAQKLINLKQSKEGIDHFMYVRFCQLLGLVAIKLLDYLDDSVYREIKRRKCIKEAKDLNKKSKKNRVKSTPANSRKSKKSTRNSTIDSSSAGKTVDESTMEGAEADDPDADELLQILENHTVKGNGLLAQFADVLINVCQRPDTFNDETLQGAAVTALMRYMLVSSEFCKEQINMLFTILGKSKFPSITVAILLHLSDLLTRFPNIVEPWTPRLYETLRDPLVEIRQATFITLSGLILRDMIRPHSHIHLMVKSLIDEDEELRKMCRVFFVTLAKKENNLFNVLPEIFAHLMDDGVGVSDEHAREIMKFLFELIDKTKHMENLVDRFCCKFELTEDLRHQRNIAYCLSLIDYNDKALNKLHENFPKYKHLVHDGDIYASFKSIMQACNKVQVGKQDLKAKVAEIEQLIKSVFEMTEDGRKMRPPPPPKSTKKRGGGAGRGRGRGRRTQRFSESSDSDSD